MKLFLSQAWQITDEQYKKLELLNKLFQEENKKINLSAIREENQIWEKHFYDSLLAAEFFQNSQKIIDLGSGGGFPLLILAIIFPEKNFFGLESVGKKCLAMEKFAKKLKLKNVKIICDRAENIGQDKNFREQFDTVTARAFTAHNSLLELALPLLKIGGKIISFRGPNHTEDEIKITQKMGAKIKKMSKKNLPSGDKREFWIIEKTKKTEKKFPRKIGIPQKKPLKLSDFRP